MASKCVFIFLITLCYVKADNIDRDINRGTMIKLLREMVNQTKADTLSLPANATSIRENIVDTFSCENRTYGYYADVDNECQVFHVCLTSQAYGGRSTTYRWSFICPNETMFNQEILTCTRPRDSIDCSDSPMYYDVNMDIGKLPNDTETNNEVNMGDSNTDNNEANNNNYNTNSDMSNNNDNQNSNTNQMNIMNPIRRKDVEKFKQKKQTNRKKQNIIHLLHEAQKQNLQEFGDSVSMDVDEEVVPVIEENVKEQDKINTMMNDYVPVIEENHNQVRIKNKKDTMKKDGEVEIPVKIEEVVPGMVEEKPMTEEMMENGRLGMERSLRGRFNRGLLKFNNVK